MKQGLNSIVPLRRSKQAARRATNQYQDIHELKTDMCALLKKAIHWKRTKIAQIGFEQLAE